MVCFLLLERTREETQSLLKKVFLQFLSLPAAELGSAVFADLSEAKLLCVP